MTKYKKNAREFFRNALKDNKIYEFIDVEHHPSTKTKTYVARVKCRICGDESLKGRYFASSAREVVKCPKCCDFLKKQGKKICWICGEIKSLDEMVGGECDECYNRSTRRVYKFLNKKKSECKKNNTEFNLTPEDLGIIIENNQIIKLPEVCPVFNTPLNWGCRGKTGPGQDSPSIDRIDPDLGYMKGNVRIVSHKYNTIKNNSSQQDRLTLAKYWTANNGGM